MRRNAASAARWGLMAMGVAVALGLSGAGCRTRLETLPNPAMLTVRWADGSPISDLMLISVNGLPYNSLRGAWKSWKRNQSVPLPLGKHTIGVRRPHRVTEFGYKEVRKAPLWTIRAEIAVPGDYTAFLDPDSTTVRVLRNADGARVDFELPTADTAAGPKTNAPATGPASPGR